MRPIIPLPVAREGSSLGIRQFLSKDALFLTQFGGLFSLSLSAILAILTLKLSSFFDSSCVTGPYFP